MADEVILPGLLLILVLGSYLSYRWVANHQTRLVACLGAILSSTSVTRMRARYDRQLRWLLRRLTPGQYLGLHLTIGLSVATGCLWFFGDLAEDVVTRDPVVRFDRAAAAYLHDLAAPGLTVFFLVVTALGSVESIALFGLLVAVLLFWRRRLELWAWIAAVAGAGALNQLLKAFFARPRPYFEQPLVLETSYSFPSGHSMLSLVL